MSAYYRSAHCLVFVYDVTDRASLHYMDDEYKLITSLCYCTSAKIVILRNKIDEHHMNRQVSIEDEHAFLLSHDIGKAVIVVCETSAKENIGIKNFFYNVLVEILQKEVPTKKADTPFNDFLGNDGKKKDNDGGCCGT